MADFHYLDDAREIWLAVKARFGGNEESKKMRKTMLKQEFSEFSVSEEEGLHKGYDRFQKILSQLNQMQAKPDNDDVNMKFLRALPFSWSQVALTLKTRGGLEYLSFDDLYNKLRSLEINVKGRSSYGSRGTTVALTHSAFIGAASTNKKMVYFDQPSHSSLIIYTSAHSGSIIEDVLHSFVAENEPTQQLAYKDFEQVDQMEMEELNIKWQMAMLLLRINKFQKKAERKINFNNKDPARFNRRKARSYNCLQLGRFARECNVKKVDEKARYSAFKISQVKTKEPKAMVSVDSMLNWNKHEAENKTEEGEQVYGLMAGYKLNFADHAGNDAGSVYDAAAEFAMIGISPKVQTCPFGCDSKLSELKKNYDHLGKLYNDSFIQVQAYTNTVKTLELQKDWYHKTQLALEEKVRILSANLENTTNTLKYSETLYDQAKIEKNEWEVKLVESLARFDKWKESSKNLAKLINSSMSTRTKLGLGFKEYIGSDEVFDLSTPSVFDPAPENKEVKSLYERFVKAGEIHEVPPSITGTFMPTSYKSNLEETQKTFDSKYNTSSINTSESNDFVSCDNSYKSSESKTYDFASCVSSPKTNDSFSTVDVKILPKSDVKDPSPTNGFPSCSFKENVKPPRNLCNKSGIAYMINCKNNFVRTKTCFVCGSKSHLIKDCDVYDNVANFPSVVLKVASVPASSRNSSASIFAGRSIPTASRNRPASIHAGRHIPAGRFNKPAPFPAGRPVPTGWTNHAARPFFRPTKLYFDNVSWPGIYDHVTQNWMVITFYVPFWNEKWLVQGATALDQMLLFHDPAVFGVPAGFLIPAGFLVAAVWLFVAILFRSCCWNYDVIPELTKTDENTTNPQQVPPTPQASHTLSIIKLPILKKEGLHKGYDRFQCLLSQLETHGAGVSTIDANQKFLRSLHSSWSQVSLIMRNKPGVDTLNFDGLYNNLRVFESDVKGSTGSSFSTQNVAFVSSDNTSSTNEVNTAFGVSTSSGHNSQKEGSTLYTDELMYSFFANQSSGLQPDHEDLKQVDEFDLEEMDLKWQVAMISTRLKKFYKKIGRKLHFNAKEPVGFDKSKDEHKAMVTIDGEGVDWTGHVEDDTEDYALMAFNSNNSGSDTKFPPPMTGNYMPSKTGFGIDESKFTYGPKQSTTSESDAKTNYLDSNESSSIWTNAPIIEEYESDSDDEHVTIPSKEQEKPSFAFVNTVKHVKTPRQTAKEQNTCSQNPKPSKRDLNGLMSKKLVSAIGGNEKLLLRPHQVVIGDTEDITRTESLNTISKSRECVDIKDPLGRLNGCSRHVTGNKAYLVDYQDFNGGLVAFEGSKGQITGKGKITTRKLDFKDVYFVKELQHFNLFSVSQMCDKKNKVLFTDTECLVLSPDFKLPDKNQVLLRVPRQHNMYSFNLENIIPSGGLACLIAKAIIDESTKWHRRLSHAEAVSTACYVLNRVLVTKPQNKTPYELLTGKFKEKSNEGFLVGYSLSSKAFRTNEESVDQEDQAFLKELERLKRQEKEANDAVKTLRKITPLNTASRPTNQDDPQIPSLEDIYEISRDGIFTSASYDDEGAVADFTNLETTVNAIKQKEDGIFISQDKYVAEILKKFDFLSVKTASTPIETKKPLVKDEEVVNVTSKNSHLQAVKRIFRYLKGHPTLGLWYPRELAFGLEAYSDSDYAGANLDRKSTTGGCQFLGRRLISWQCEKQTIVATSTTKAKYVAAASCCGQVLWI
nr:uncharacterized mitochondrial protein AtMg00810-like [Tanacetum cinerariifolium]